MSQGKFAFEGRCTYGGVLYFTIFRNIENHCLCSLCSTQGTTIHILYTGCVYRSSMLEHSHFFSVMRLLCRNKEKFLSFLAAPLLTYITLVVRIMHAFRIIYRSHVLLFIDTSARRAPARSCAAPHDSLEFFLLFTARARVFSSLQSAPFSSRSSLECQRLTLTDAQAFDECPDDTRSLHTIGGGYARARRRTLAVCTVG